MDKLGKRLLAVVLAGLLVCGAGLGGTVSVAASQTGDDGTTNWGFIVPVTHQTTVPAGYIGIFTAQQLSDIRNNLSGKYILMNNIDLAGWNWEPIGALGNGFSGTFNGNGYVIENLNVVALGNAGLFGNCLDSSIIQNLGLVDSQVQGGSHVGGIAGWSRTISNCFNIGDVYAISTCHQLRTTNKINSSFLALS